MPVSIYYSYYRSYGLTELERKSISETVERYSVDDQIEEYFKTGKGWDGEEFHLYDDPLDSPDMILQGSTALPISTIEIFCIALQHWCNLLSEINRILPNSDWQVSVDDHEIPWDKEQQKFDVTKLNIVKLQQNILFVKGL